MLMRSYCLLFKIKNKNKKNPKTKALAMIMLSVGWVDYIVTSIDPERGSGDTSTKMYEKYFTLKQTETQLFKLTKSHFGASPGQKDKSKDEVKNIP